MPIFPSRLHLAVAVMSLITLLTSLIGVITGIPSSRVERVGAREELKDSLQVRLGAINKMHSELTEARRETVTSLDQLQKIADLIRSPGGVGIPEAHAGWSAAKQSYGKARTALLGDKASLGAKTSDLLERSKVADGQMNRLLSLLEDKADRDYLAALDRSYAILVQAHTAYLKVYEELVKVMPAYESLFEKTDAFLTEEAAGRFRSKKDASSAYVQRSNDPLRPIQQARPRLDELTEAAVKLERQASAAFKNAATLRTRTRSP